jgi:hypothetical protein
MKIDNVQPGLREQYIRIVVFIKLLHLHRLLVLSSPPNIRFSLKKTLKIWHKINRFITAFLFSELIFNHCKESDKCKHFHFCTNKAVLIREEAIEITRELKGYDNVNTFKQLNA